jgi:ATP-dependent Clp protease ATP-binding subunit ClpB
MRLDKFTLRGQEAIQSAIELGERNQHQQVEPEHLLIAMLEQPEGIVRPVLGKLGANVAVILNDTQAAVARFPRVATASGQDAGRVYLHRASAAGARG